MQREAHAITGSMQLGSCSMNRHSAGQLQLGLPEVTLQRAKSHDHALEANAKFVCEGVLQHDMTLLVHNHPGRCNRAPHQTLTGPAEPSGPAAKACTQQLSRW